MGLAHIACQGSISKFDCSRMDVRVHFPFGAQHDSAMRQKCHEPLLSVQLVFVVKLALDVAAGRPNVVSEQKCGVAFRGCIAGK